MAVEIKINNAKKMYGNNTVIENLSLDINGGEFFTLLGPSGCGKTTLLRMIAGFNSIEGGEFYFGDKLINDLDPAKRNIGMVFQNYAIFPHLTVRKNVEFGLKNRKYPKEKIKEDTDEFLKLMQIEEYQDRLPERLSGGQQQRVALARALVIRPDVLLMDEPLSNLDAKLRVEMRTVIKNIQNKLGITTVYVTHDQEEAMAVGDRLAVLRKGVVEQIGSSDELYNEPNNAFVANFIGKMNFFESETISVDSDSYSVKIKGSNVGITVRKEKSHIEPRIGERVLVGGRPEHLIVSAQKTDDSIEGRVHIIQHLGSFIRYEVDISKDISPVTLEIDMDSLQKDIHEGDKVFVSFKKERLYLFSPEGREL